MELLSVPTDIQPSDAVAEQRPSRLSDALSARTKAALGRWQQFRLGWIEAWSPETPIQTLSECQNLGMRGFMQEHADEPAVVVKSQYQHHHRGWGY